MPHAYNTKYIAVTVSCWASKCDWNRLIQHGLALASALNILPKYIYKLTQIHLMRLKLNCHRVVRTTCTECAGRLITYILNAILSIIASNRAMLAFTNSFKKPTFVCIWNRFCIDAERKIQSHNLRFDLIWCQLPLCFCFFLIKMLVNYKSIKITSMYNAWDYYNAFSCKTCKFEFAYTCICNA